MLQLERIEPGMYINKVDRLKNQNGFIYNNLRHVKLKFCKNKIKNLIFLNEIQKKPRDKQPLVNLTRIFLFAAKN